jgi:hypothetical protein
MIILMKNKAAKNFENFFLADKLIIKFIINIFKI